MNNETLKLLSERLALLEANNCGYKNPVITASEPEPQEHNESKKKIRTDLEDFDFDTTVETEFDVFMITRYFWQDWKSGYSEVY